MRFGSSRGALESDFGEVGLAVNFLSIPEGSNAGRTAGLVTRAIIRTRSLLFGAALVLAGLVALTGWMSWDAREQAWRHALQSSENLVGAFDDDIQRIVTSYDLSLQAVVDGLKEDAVWDLEPRIRDMALFDRAATQQYLGSILVTDESGRILFDSRSQIPPKQNLADREYFLAQSENPHAGPYISRPFLSRIDGVWEIAVSRRWEHVDGSFAGVVVGTIQLEFFHQLFDKVETGSQGSITLVTDKGVIVTRKPFKEEEYGHDLKDPVLIDLFAAHRTGHFERTANLDGISRLYVYRQIGDYPLFISTGVPLADIYADWWQKTVIVAMVTIGLAAVAALLGGLCFAELRRRSRAEGQAAALAAQYKLLADNSTDVIIRLGFDGIRRYVSPSAGKLLFYAPEEMIGRDATELTHAEDCSVLIAARDRLRRGEGDQIVTYRMRRKDGNWVWVETTLSAIRDAGSGEPREIVAVMRDIGSRRSMEQELVATVRELEAARDAAEQATRAKSQFLATVSHELRTPLNGVLGFADLLHRTNLTPEQRNYVELQLEAGKTLLSIINDILDFSKLEAGKLDIASSIVDVRTTIESCVDWFRGAARDKGLQLDCELADDLPRSVETDGARLQQILANLLSNAVKFTRSGVIAVNARRGTSARGQRLVIAVTDTGIGIPQEKIGMLFQRFSQVDGSMSREFGGTGLGLAISQRLAQLMGGRIAVASEYGVGSIFTLDLPLEPVSAPPQALPPSVTTGMPGKLKLLLVEDHRTNQRLVEALLGEIGYAVDTVENGEEALRAIADNYYDLVLMDVQMPVMDGLQATARIRALPGEKGKVPIVAITAHVRPEDVARCLAAGMQAHVGKPINRDELLAAIARAAGKTVAA